MDTYIDSFVVWCDRSKVAKYFSLVGWIAMVVGFSISIVWAIILNAGLI